MRTIDILNKEDNDFITIDLMEAWFRLSYLEKQNDSRSFIMKKVIKNMIDNDSSQLLIQVSDYKICFKEILENANEESKTKILLKKICRNNWHNNIKMI